MSSIRATLGLSIFAALGTMSSGASALPIDNGAPAVLQRNVEEARLVCDALGRCVQTRPPVIRVVPPRVIVPPRVVVSPRVVVPGIGLGRPVYRRPGIGVPGGFDVERRREVDRVDRGRGDVGDQGGRRRPDEGKRRRGDQMQGDGGDQGGQHMRGQGQGGGQKGQGRRRMQDGGQGGQGGGQGGGADEQ